MISYRIMLPYKEYRLGGKNGCNKTRRHRSIKRERQIHR